MTTNSAFNQDILIINGKDNPSTYQSPNNLGTDSYGTFVNDVRGSPMTTTTVSSYPYGMSSQSQTIMVLGSCPACKTGTLEIDFTFLGVCCAIFFFPIGLLFCFAFRQHRCNFCGAIFP